MGAPDKLGKCQAGYKFASEQLATRHALLSMVAGLASAQRWYFLAPCFLHNTVVSFLSSGVDLGVF